MIFRAHIFFVGPKKGHTPKQNRIEMELHWHHQMVVYIREPKSSRRPEVNWWSQGRAAGQSSDGQTGGNPA